MAIIHEKVQNIVDLLINRARNNQTIRYSEIYSIMKGYPTNDVWDTFEEACAKIQNEENLPIYGSIMSNSEDLPESGFFNIFRTKRSKKYEEIAGKKLEQNLNEDEKRQITEFERSEVFEHSKTI